MFKNALALCAVSLLGLSSTAFAAGTDKITYCHNTGSETNPWIVLTTSVSAFDAHVRNHGDHRGFGYNKETGELQCVPRKCDAVGLVKAESSDPTNIWNIDGSTWFYAIDKQALAEQATATLYLEELTPDGDSRIGSFRMDASRATEIATFDPSKVVAKANESFAVLTDSRERLVEYTTKTPHTASIEFAIEDRVLCSSAIQEEIYYRAAPEASE